jgi:hypothetical protein
MRRRTRTPKVHRGNAGSSREEIGERDAADDELRVDLFAKAATDFMFTPLFAESLRRARPPKDLAAYLTSLTILLKHATTPDGWDELRRSEPGLRRHAAKLGKLDAAPGKASRKPRKRKLEANGLTLDQAAEVEHLQGLATIATRDKRLAERFGEALRRFQLRRNIWDIACETVKLLRREDARRDRAAARRRRRHRP